MLFRDIDLHALDRVCAKIAEISRNRWHIIFLLYGDIGAGKTSLVKEYVRFCGIRDSVTSPTFSLMHEYSGGIFHYDLYHRSMEDLLCLGIFDLLANDGIHFVEWANDELKAMLCEAFGDIITIKIDRGIEARDYEIKGYM